MHSIRQALFVLAGVNLLLLGAIFGLGAYHWAREYGPIETLQVLALFCAAAAFLYRARRADDPFWTMNVVLFLLCLGAAVRELDPRDSIVSDDLSQWLRSGIQGRIMGALSAIGGVMLWVKRHQWPEMLRLLFSPQGFVFAGAGALVLTGEVLENWLKFYPRVGPVIEELTELNGMLLFLLAALFLPFKPAAMDAAR